MPSFPLLPLEVLHPLEAKPQESSSSFGMLSTAQPGPDNEFSSWKPQAAPGWGAAVTLANSAVSTRTAVYPQQGPAMELWVEMQAWENTTVKGEEKTLDYLKQ